MANVLPVEKRVQLLACLVDGVSIRAISRVTDVHQDTIGRLALSVGEGCARLHDRMFVDLRCSMLQLDEQWSFVHTKQGHLHEKSDETHGDAWTFCALDVASRAIVSYLIGRRTEENATTFLHDVRRRVLGTPMISSDGFRPYVDAVEESFGIDCRFGMLVKQYTNDATGKGRANYKGAMPVGVVGKVDSREINTSYVERANLTTRTDCQRFTRRTNAHSKRLRNHCAAVALHYAHYNLVRVHSTLKVTPAMQLGVSDHVWSLAELMDAALSAPPPDVRAVVGLPDPVGPRPGPTLRVIDGGRR